MKKLTLEELNELSGGFGSLSAGYYTFTEWYKGNTCSFGTHGAGRSGPYGTLAQAEEIGRNDCYEHYKKEGTYCCYRVAYLDASGVWTEYPEVFVGKPV